MLLGAHQAFKDLYSYIFINFREVSGFQIIPLPLSLSPSPGTSTVHILADLMMAHSLLEFTFLHFFSFCPPGFIILIVPSPEFSASFFYLLTSGFESLQWIVHFNYCSFQLQNFFLVPCVLSTFLVQGHVRDTVGSVPDHPNKSNITVK